MLGIVAMGMDAQQKADDRSDADARVDNLDPVSQGGLQQQFLAQTYRNRNDGGILERVVLVAQVVFVFNFCRNRVASAEFYG